MNSGLRIIINTCATFIRTLLNAALALFCSRWVLMGLGESDFGIYNVVISLSVFVMFLNTVLAGSSSRFFSFSVGGGDQEDINKWFNVSFGVHICLAISLTVFGWFLGDIVVSEILNIPSQRVGVALLVFRITLLTSFLGMLAVPFTAMFISRQRIAELALFGVLQSILAFCLAWSVTVVQGDRLVVYSVGVGCIQSIIVLMQIVRASVLFEECALHFRHWFERDRLKQIFIFTSWSILGNLGVLFRNQGLAVLLNLYFGARVNAAYGIANQVSNQANHLSSALMGAISPEITASEGRGDRKRMLALALQASKLATILVLFFTIPLMAEMDHVLKLWLHEPPEYTSLLCRFILCAFVIDRMTSGYIVAVNAYGEIAWYQITTGVALMLTLPFSWIVLGCGGGIYSIGFVFVGCMIIASCCRVIWMKKLFHISVLNWFYSLLVPCMIVVSVSAIGSWGVVSLLDETLFRIVVNAMISSVLILLSSWLLVMNRDEKNFVMRLMNKLLYSNNR